MRRIFIAINPDERMVCEIGKLVAGAKSSFLNAAGEIRFLPQSNWHITLSFLGYQDDNSLLKILDGLKKTATGLTAQTLEFNKISYGPPGKNPKMIWFLGNKETSERLALMRRALNDNLEKFGVRFRRETRPFEAHITLARLNPSSESRLPLIERALKLRFAAKSLDIMESELKRGGAEYTILQSFPLASLVLE